MTRPQSNKKSSSHVPNSQLNHRPENGKAKSNEKWKMGIQSQQMPETLQNRSNGCPSCPRKDRKRNGNKKPPNRTQQEEEVKNPSPTPEKQIYQKWSNLDQKFLSYRFLQRPINPDSLQIPSHPTIPPLQKADHVRHVIWRTPRVLLSQA